MMYFTVEIKKEKSEYVQIVASDVVTAINWALKHCETEGATVSDVRYVSGAPVAIVEG